MHDSAWIGRNVVLLLRGVPSMTIKVSAVNGQEVVGIYEGDEEVHVDLTAIVAWHYGKPERKQKGKKKGKKEE